ncbi:MAG TPA: hypothetical protein VG474_09600 [Solirubrobacteraceae bacterium]|nr:hypothetical protein [Solirubrobacteraceae bacterium]
MRFFRGDKNGSSSNAGPAARRVEIADDQLGAVIEECAQRVIEGMHDAPLARKTLELLQLGLPYMIQRDCSDEAVIAGQTAARLGYLSRSVEFVRFEAARTEDPDLVEVLGERLDAAPDDEAAYDAMAELAAAMASEESLDPAPDEGGPSSTLPGLGAAARRMLRVHLLSGIRPPPDIVMAELELTWKYGYFLRALDELTDEGE